MLGLSCVTIRKKKPILLNNNLSRVSSGIENNKRLLFSIPLQRVILSEKKITLVEEHRDNSTVFHFQYYLEKIFNRLCVRSSAITQQSAQQIRRRAGFQYSSSCPGHHRPPRHRPHFCRLENNLLLLLLINQSRNCLIANKLILQP